MINISGYIDGNPLAGKNLWAIISTYRLVRQRMGRKSKLSALHAVVITAWFETRLMAMTREKGGLAYMVADTDSKVSYCGKYGNDDDPSYNGDAWTFRGFGWCQLTFRDNYERAFTRYTKLGFDDFGKTDVKSFVVEVARMWASSDIGTRQKALLACCTMCACHVADAENGVALIASVTGRGSRGRDILDQRANESYY